MAIGLGAIVVLGVGSQWFSRLTKTPSIVVLLLAGIVAGPVTGIVDPEKLFGDTLDPAVSLAVGLLLFDSGQSLDFAKLTTGHTVVRRLVVVGGGVTWLLGWVAAYLVFDMSFEIAALLGAVLVVSGPTVIEPILSLARPREPIGTILSWEGTILDPVGGALGVVVLSVITSVDHELGAGPKMIATTVTGVGVGLICAFVLVMALRHMRIPDDLQVPVAFMFAVLAFTTANVLFAEAGLFATVTLGLVLANQKSARTREIREFQASIGTLIIAVLFIVLAATIDLGELVDVLIPSMILLAILVVIVRPAAAFLATARVKLDWRDRAFAACVAPRGIVAASTVSFYAITLQSSGLDGAKIVPITFAVIIGAGIVYGFGAPVMANVLQVSQDEPRGVVLFAQESISGPIACALAAEQIPVLVVVAEAESPPTGSQQFDVYSGDIYSEGFGAALTTADVGTAVIVAADRGHEIHARERCLRQMDSRSIFIVPREPHAIRSGWRSLSESSPPRGLIPFFPEITRDVLVGIASTGEPAWIDPEAGQWPIPQGATPLFLVVDGDHAVVSTPRAMARSLRGRNQAIEPRLLVWTAPSQATSSGQQESPA